MKREKMREIHQKTLPELRKLLVEAREGLLKLKMEVKGGKIKDVHAIAKKRDEIARLATIIRGKELEALP